MAERRLSPAIPPPDDLTADGSERSIVIVSEEADALVESLTSYVEDTVNSLLGSPAGAAAGTGESTPSPVEIHQIPSNAAAALKARANAQRADTTKGNAAQRDGGDGAAFFSCGDCTFGADSAEQAHPSPPRRPMHTRNIMQHSAMVPPPPPRAVTMEEPYFSDELNSVREMEALKRSVNDMQLTGAMHVASADVSSQSLPPAAPALGVGQHRRTLSNNSRSRSLMTGKLSPEKLAESEHIVDVSSSTATDTATGTSKHSRDESILFAAGPAEADLPPARPEPPEHERWAVASSTIDLSGDWTIIADERFKKQYNAYLANLGFGFVLRNVALGVIGSTTEHTSQTHDGRRLLIRGKNPRGVWERLLVASGYPDFDTHSSLTESVHYEHKKVTVQTADSEAVEAEAWWEDGGTVHRSWLRGGTKYGGGDFESCRYLEEGSNGQVLVCRSIFHPNDKRKPRAEVLWRYKRNK